MYDVSRRELYHAVKYQVEEFHADCGFTVVEMWEVVNAESFTGYYWKQVCLSDYRQRKEK